MSIPAYIGDEVSAAGFRLAGLQVFTPLPDDVMPAIRRACEQAPLVLLSAATAQLLDETELDELLAGIVIMLVGNLVGIMLEGLVVTIQTTRLILFEICIRFLQFTGRMFRTLEAPATISANTRREM